MSELDSDEGSPLFVAYMNWIESHSRVDEVVTVEKHRINCLLFVDDLALLASSEQGLQHALDWFIAACHQTGMKMSTRRPKAYYVALESKPSVRCK